MSSDIVSQECCLNQYINGFCQYSDLPTENSCQISKSSRVFISRRPFCEKEDEKLLYLKSKYKRDWDSIMPSFKNRTKKQLQNRIRWLQKKQQDKKFQKWHQQQKDIQKMTLPLEVQGVYQSEEQENNNKKILEDTSSICSFDQFFFSDNSVFNLYQDHQFDLIL